MSDDNTPDKCITWVTHGLGEDVWYEGWFNQRNVCSIHKDYHGNGWRVVYGGPANVNFCSTALDSLAHAQARAEGLVSDLERLALVGEV